jgi:hypothetical protein
VWTAASAAALRVSGCGDGDVVDIDVLEEAGWEAYAARTSSFLPRPPRR